MRTIGLLGGMSFEGSATYYRLINEGVRDRVGGLNSAELILGSLNFNTIERSQQADHWDQASRYLADAAKGLERAGAKQMHTMSGFTKQRRH
jgi:aspartate racemase